MQMQQTQTERTGDLVLPQGTYVLIQDGASGHVEVLVGPHKASLADTDKTVIYNPETRRFQQVPAQEAITTCPTATEGQYIVLTNPESEKNTHPSKGKQAAPGLNVGSKINVQGPDTFALFPGQFAEVVKGHQLKSNEYLIIRVYNEVAAKENLKNAIVIASSAEDSTQKKVVKGAIREDEIFTGNLLIIRGTDISFYIPPTGIEVLKENGSYVRNAVTLERLEYCILLDQNGDKRYVEGPAVVFPKPTEVFVEQNGSTKFKAVELNDNMGLYVKVIADYEEGKKSYTAGEELFITGKDKKIYFPRPEHAVIKYGDDMLHFATAIPRGEARYVLNKESGEIALKEGPCMFIPDPRKEVIVKRILDTKLVGLWFPGNEEAVKHNTELEEIAVAQGMTGHARSFSGAEDSYSNSLKSKSRSIKKSAMFSAVADELQRSTSYTKPRTLTLDTKYDGAVMINVWPGHAIQVVKKTGERQVVLGPKTVMLEYDESLETLALSTGTPKRDDKMLLKTVYLQTENNVVSDVIETVTKDLVDVDIRLSYRVNFEGEQEKWFGVSNYVKLMTRHLRSMVRNQVKKIEIEEFNDNATDILRDLILGTPTGEKGKQKRKGRTFEENGMRIYDVEVLDIEIGDEGIADLLLNSQHNTVEQNLRIKSREKELEFTKKSENITRQTLEESAKTEEIRAKLKLQEIDAKKTEDEVVLANDVAKQDGLDEVTTRTRVRTKAKEDLVIAHEQTRSEIRINEAEKKAASVQPGLITAITSLGHLNNNEILAKNLKAQGGGLADIFQKGGIDGLLAAVKGTPLADQIKEFFDVNESQDTNS